MPLGPVYGRIVTYDFVHAEMETALSAVNCVQICNIR